MKASEKNSLRPLAALTPSHSTPRTFTDDLLGGALVGRTGAVLTGLSASARTRGRARRPPS